MISQDAWNAWLSVAAIVLLGAAALYVAYLRARPTDPQPDNFGEEMLGDWPAHGTRASEDK